MTTERALKDAIKSGVLPKVVLLCGDEHYIIRDLVKKIEAAAVPQNPDFNITELKNDVSVQKIYDAVITLPMFAPVRCVTVCDFDPDKAKIDDFKTMLDIIKNIGDHCVLVLYFETVVIPEKKRSDRANKLIKAVEETGGIATYIYRKSDAELQKALSAGAARRGVTLPPAQARHMTDFCGNDLYTLTNELEKLCIYAEGKTVTDEMIDRVCSRSVDAAVYNLTKYIIAKNASAAQKLLDELFFMRTEPVFILSVIAGSFCDIFRAAAAEKSGVPIPQAAGELGYPKNLTFRLSNAARDARRYKNDDICRALDLISRTDRRLKSAPCDPKTELQTLITELMTLGGKNQSGGARYA